MLSREDAAAERDGGGDLGFAPICSPFLISARRNRGIPERVGVSVALRELNGEMTDFQPCKPNT